MAYDQVVIMCSRVGNPHVLIVDGASKTKCEQCGHDVWIAPSSRKMRIELKAKVICEACHPLRPKPGEAIDVVPLTKEQIGEIQGTIENQKRRN